MAMPISRADYSLKTVRETCERLRIGWTTLYTFIQRGWLTPIRYGRSVRIDPVEIEQLIAKRRAPLGGEQ